ncbi:response regulator transcription factor [Kibdelosporangium aridum]|uniref:Response regulatory domain-containing protein n=1 Tax=Kibdelosporangium aridum TaxID=2030 RepID=A0A1W2DQS4_KIBAR|nr:hypothetical protein SAMN05661093_03715 [Kibdelosporangium aridum]
MAAGASGYLAKDSDGAKILHAARRIAGGNGYVSPMPARPELLTDPALAVLATARGEVRLAGGPVVGAGGLEGADSVTSRLGRAGEDGCAR